MNFLFFTYIVFILGSSFIVLSDIKTMHISLLWNYICLCLLIFLYILQGKNCFFNHISSTIFMFSIFFIVRILAKKGLGLGDLHYSLTCGIFCGFPNFMLASIIFSGLGILYFLLKKIILKTDIKRIRIPFTPFMFIGSLIATGIKIN